MDPSNLENIRNIGANRGELDAHFATIENIDVRVRDVARAQREHIIDIYNGVLDKLSTMFTGANFTPECVDDTGRERKITFMANVTYSTNCKDDNSNIQNEHMSTRNVFMHLGIPTNFTMNVVEGVPPVYGNPAVAEAEYAVQGGYNDRSSQKVFLNRLHLNNNTYMTAAAMQMAYFYVNYFLLPRLNGAEEGFETIAIPAAGYRDNPTPYQTSYLPSELVSHHSLTTISCLYYALQARQVLAAAGMDVLPDRVFNATCDLPAAFVQEDDFWTAWHVLKHSSQGSSNSDQWDLDFLMLIVQNFSLHGISHEGGLWRQLFKGFPVMPNQCVVVSNYTPNTVGFCNISDRMILGSAVTIQAHVSRALYETNIDNSKFMLPPSASGSDVHEVLMMMQTSIVALLTQSTGMSPDYWDEYTKGRSIDQIALDRHISTTHSMFMKNFSPFIVTYSLSLTGDKIGRHSFEPLNTCPLKFTGEYHMPRVMHDNQLFLCWDMNRELSFKDGLFYMHPKVDDEGRLLELHNRGAFTGRNEPLSDNITLVDGQSFEYGQAVGDKSWRDNYDIMPTSGDCLSVNPISMLLDCDLVPHWLSRGTYCINVGRYSVATKERGESKLIGKTRTDLKAHRRGGVEAYSYGNDRHVTRDVENYLKRWKRMSRLTAQRKLRVLRNARRRTEEQVRKNYGAAADILFSDSEVQKRMVRDRVVKTGECLSFLYDLKQLVASGEYEVTDNLTVTWMRLQPNFPGIHFTLPSTRAVNARIKNQHGDVAFDYGIELDARVWDEDTMIQECSILIVQIENLLETIEEQVINTINVVAGPEMQSWAYEQFRDVHFRVSQETMVEDREKKARRPPTSEKAKLFFPSQQMLSFMQPIVNDSASTRPEASAADRHSEQTNRGGVEETKDSISDRLTVEPTPTQPEIGQALRRVDDHATVDGTPANDQHNQPDISSPTEGGANNEETMESNVNTVTNIDEPMQIDAIPQLMGRRPNPAMITLSEANLDILEAAMNANRNMAARNNE